MAIYLETKIYMTKKSFLLMFSVAVLPIFSFAQNRLAHSFSREETTEILLDKSKKEKTKGFISLGGGLALSAVGIALLKKDPNTLTANGSGWTVTESDNHVLGGVILGLGTVTTLTSPFLFARAGRLKHKAKLVLSDESTSFLSKKLSVPSIGVQIGF
jgi:hypothetical protein